MVRGVQGGVQRRQVAQDGGVVDSVVVLACQCVCLAVCGSPMAHLLLREEHLQVTHTHTNSVRARQLLLTGDTHTRPNGSGKACSAKEALNSVFL